MRGSSAAGAVANVKKSRVSVTHTERCMSAAPPRLMEGNARLLPHLEKIILRSCPGGCGSRWYARYADREAYRKPDRDLQPILSPNNGGSCALARRPPTGSEPARRGGMGSSAVKLFRCYSNPIFSMLQTRHFRGLVRRLSQRRLSEAKGLPR